MTSGSATWLRGGSIDTYGGDGDGGGGGTGTGRNQVSSASMAYCVDRDFSSCNSQNASPCSFHSN